MSLWVCPKRNRRPVLNGRTCIIKAMLVMRSLSSPVRMIYMTWSWNNKKILSASTVRSRILKGFLDTIAIQHASQRHRGCEVSILLPVGTNDKK